MEKKVIEMLIKDFEDEVFAISVVTKPAIEENFVALSEHEVELKTIDEDKRILLGAVLVPDKEILRVDKEGNPYYIKFSTDTIKQSSELFLMRSKQNNVTLQHSQKLDDMSVVESWIVEDSKVDKSALYDLNYPIGTWVAMMKVNNDSVWEQVKSGAIKGFSIEGKFSDNQELSTIEQIKELLKQL
jgi:hypothetical protein